VSAVLFARAAVMRERMHKPLHLLVQERRAEGSPRGGVIVVPPASAVADVAGLKGKRMLYVDPDSSSGFVYPRMRVRALGLDPDTHFATVTFAGSHDEVVRRLKAGEADAGAISELTAGLSGLKIIERTADIPDDAIVSLEGLGPADRDKVAALLLRAHQTPALTGLFVARSIDRYVPGVVEVFKQAQDEVERTTAEP
jgi:ABC-type phosphate/phosphonate transport system substrate-binding protein